MKADRLHRRYRQLRDAERRVAAAAPGYKAKRRREKVRVLAEILRAELGRAA